MNLDVVSCGAEKWQGLSLQDQAKHIRAASTWRSLTKGELEKLEKADAEIASADTKRKAVEEWQEKHSARSKGRSRAATAKGTRATSGTTSKTKSDDAST